MPAVECCAFCCSDVQMRHQINRKHAAGLQDYDAQTRSENASLRQQVKELEATLHKMRLQLRNVLDMSKEATTTFESNAKKLDEDIKLRKEQEHKVELVCLWCACVERRKDTATA